jgi:hypothetical protein
MALLNQDLNVGDIVSLQDVNGNPIQYIVKNISIDCTYLKKRIAILFLLNTSRFIALIEDSKDEWNHSHFIHNAAYMYSLAVTSIDQIIYYNRRQVLVNLLTK